MSGHLLKSAIVCIGVSILLPSANAWTLHNPESPPAQMAAWALWGTAPGGTDLPGDLRPAVACALGDANGDGVDDILVRVQDSKPGIARLKALAGPDFKDTIWQMATKGQRELHCAPDLNADGIADPVASLVAPGDGSSPGQEATDRAVQVLDGASGQTLLRRQHQDTDTSAGSAGVAANSTATSNLLPAAAGAEAFVKTEVQQSALSGLSSSLPTSSLTATARRAAEFQLLDVKGTVQGVITVDTPGVDPLAMAPLPIGMGLPDVAVLTAKTASPVQEASQRIPTLSRFNPDGSLAWAVELSGTQGLPILIPRAGDLDLDGVEDLIVETAETGLGAGPASQFLVLSGIDGKQLLSSGAPVDGLVAALPLGSLPTGEPAILSAVQAQGAAKLTLAALKASGEAAWSVEVEPGSIPINALTDAYTGDPLGFTDLTGDGLPDVGLAARKGSDLVLQAVNGADGSIAWTRTLADVERVIPVSARDALHEVTSAGVPHASDLLAIGNASHGPVLSLVQGTTGEIAWKLTGQLPAGTTRVGVVAHAAGDIDGDQVQDLLVTLDPGVMGGADESIHAVSGAAGAAVWSNTTDPSKPVLALTQERGPAFEERAEALATEAAGRSPTPGAASIVGVLALAVLLRRLRR